MAAITYAKLSPTCKQNVRRVIASFCLRAEQNKAIWHYSQNRPFRGYNVPPDQWHSNDCSGYVSLAFSWAMHWTHCYLADPLGYNYSGIGNTGTMLDWLKEHGGRVIPGSVQKLLVGDIVLYGNPYTSHGHTTIVTGSGTQKTAWVSSNGSEGGPYKVRLRYRDPDDLLGVWRHPALL